MNFEKLPFVKTDEKGQVVSTWNVTPTGDYSVDCATGCKYFSELMMVMRNTGNCLLLSRVMTGQGAVFSSWGAIEIGFHQQMGQELMVE